MILLIHHGDAVAPSVDASRPLSAAGRAQAERVAEEAKSRGAKPDLVWHSGKLRAKQTAEHVWRACNPLAPMAAVRGLQPDDPPDWMHDRLAGEAGSIAIVGHMPHLARLLVLLAGSPGQASPSFPLHGCVALIADGDRWTEAWRIG